MASNLSWFPSTSMQQINDSARKLAERNTKINIHLGPSSWSMNRWWMMDWANWGFKQKPKKIRALPFDSNSSNRRFSSSSRRATAGLLRHRGEEPTLCYASSWTGTASSIRLSSIRQFCRRRGQPPPSCFVVEKITHDCLRFVEEKPTVFFIEKEWICFSPRILRPKAFQTDACPTIYVPKYSFIKGRSFT